MHYKKSDVYSPSFASYALFLAGYDDRPVAAFSPHLLPSGWVLLAAPDHGSSNKSRAFQSSPCVTSTTTKMSLSPPTRPKVCYSVF